MLFVEIILLPKELDDELDPIFVIELITQRMSHHYIVSVQQPSTVTHCIKGHFLSPSSLDVIVAKVSKLEVYSVSESGLSPVYEVPIYGRIAALCKYGSSRRFPPFCYLL